MKKGVFCILIFMLMIVSTIVPVSGSIFAKEDSQPTIKGNIQYGEVTNLNENETRHLFCFIESGDVQLRNFQGRFYGIPISTNSGIRHLGVGTFHLNLSGWNQSSGASLTITQFHRQAHYFHNVSIYVKIFIGWYQPTGDLSGGALKGFALSIKINPLMK
jgi:hypothetical protein